jgi:hypothetical protein
VTKEKLSELEALCEKASKLVGWSKITTIQIRPEVVLDLIAEVKRQRDVIEKLRAALEFYASPISYESEMSRTVDEFGRAEFYSPDVLSDEGSRAREALKETSE